MVNERLAANDGDSIAPGWRLRLDATAPATSSAPAVVTGTLLDPTGTARESKELTVAATDCDAAALVFASMVERFFHGIGWTSNAPLPSLPVSNDSTPAPPPPTPWTFGIDLSGGAIALFGGGVSAHALAGVGLTAANRDVGRLRLEILVAGPASHRSETDGTGATGSQDSWPLRATLVYCGLRRPVTWQGGIDALFNVDQARSTGVVPPGTDQRLTVAIGLTAGARVSLTQRWSLLVDVAADRHLAGKRFVIIPGDTPPQTFILDPPTWQALFTARALYSFGP
jgi:hypothetical protein